MVYENVIKVISVLGATLGVLGLVFFFMIMEKTEQSFSLVIPCLLVCMVGIAYLVYSSFQKK